MRISDWSSDVCSSDLGAVMFGHREMQAVIKAINELVAEVGAKDFPWQAPAPQTELIDAIKAVIGNRLGDAFRIQIKPERKEAISALKKEVLEALKEQAAAKGWTPDRKSTRLNSSH